jgi:flagellum-specific peptidoglycan hydrolase FlgJ
MPRVLVAAVFLLIASTGKVKAPPAPKPLQNKKPTYFLEVGKTSEIKARVLQTTRSKKERDFLELAIPLALQVSEQYGVPPSAVVGMAVYESGYGSSALSKKHHNYFGMKADKKWTGRAVRMPTKDSGVRTTAVFRAFPDAESGFAHFGEFLASRPRYRGAFNYSDGPTFVRKVARAGYCPDLDYADAVKRIIKRHNLYLLDSQV